MKANQQFHRSTMVTLAKDTAVSLSVGVIAGALLAVTLTKKKSTPPIRGPSNKPWRMSKWVQHNGVVRTQGLVGDPDKSAAEQTQEALDKLDEILQEADLTRANLISVTIFIADYDNKFDEMNQVYDAWVDKAGLPTRLCVQAYLGPKYAVEIRAEAWCED
jgi:enamine deaminase RidA (YjgF/YER057c/UK114 family)